MKSNTMNRLFATATVLSALAAPAIAQEEAAGIHIPGASAKVTLDYVSNYFFRGVEQSDADAGVVLQPGASFTIPVVDSVTATVGTWGSIHTGADSSTAGSNPRSWYEQDIYASLDATMGDFTAGVGLTYYTYPSTTANRDITELNLKVGYNDSEMLGEFAFAPYVMVAVELQNNPGTDEKTYLEIGGAFTLPTEGTSIEAWTWTVPVTLGMSLDEYYVDASGADEPFGYLKVGLLGTISMSELIGTDEWVGAWDLTAGVFVLLLNSDVPGQVDNADDTGDNFQVYAHVGLSRSW